MMTQYGLGGEGWALCIEQMACRGPLSQNIEHCAVAHAVIEIMDDHINPAIPLKLTAPQFLEAVAHVALISTACPFVGEPGGLNEQLIRAEQLFNMSWPGETWNLDDYLSSGSSGT